MNTPESVLTRRLGIRFIDARAMATEAKLNLNIDGYPNSPQKERIVEEAIRIFEGQAVGRKILLRIQNQSLQTVKYGGMIDGDESVVSSSNCLDGSLHADLETSSAHSYQSSISKHGGKKKRFHFLQQTKPMTSL